MGVVYKITAPSGKAYVGQTRRELKRRMHGHKSMCGRRKDSLWGKAVRKYGWNAMTIEVLWRGANDELDGKEREMITLHGTLAPAGYNSTPGGDANPMDGQAGRDAVKASWARDDVRAKHTKACQQAWADDDKRSNIMRARAENSKVAMAKVANKQNSREANAKRTQTWEAKREERLAGLVGKARAQKLARLNRDRERHRKGVESRAAQTGIIAARHVMETHE